MDTVRTYCAITVQVKLAELEHLTALAGTIDGVRPAMSEPCAVHHFLAADGFTNISCETRDDIHETKASAALGWSPWGEDEAMPPASLFALAPYWVGISASFVAAHTPGLAMSLQVTLPEPSIAVEQLQDAA